MVKTDLLTITRELERLRPWVPAIRAACLAWDEDPFLLSAICLRESGAGWAPGYEPKGKPDGWGDNGHGFGLFQIDIRYHRGFVLSADARDPSRQAVYACRILHENRHYLKHSASMPPDNLERAAVAAYNAGVGSVIHRVILGEDPDLATTGHDYSHWVFEKQAALYLAAPKLFAVPQQPSEIA